MKNGQWQKVKEIFDLALQQKPENRQKYINQACGDDKNLVKEIESLLASLGNADEFLETPAIEEVAEVIADNHKPQLSKHFGHYEIIKQIGAGGMGAVYLAKDSKLNRQVAIKILNEKFAKHESNLQRFIKEAQSASALNHPNILVIHEIGESDNSHFIVSEFVEGKTLRQLLAEKNLQLSEIIEITTQIANALTAAHAAKIVHRDIKPENIIIRPDGYVKILDFGLAKLVEQKNIGFDESTIKQNETAKGIVMGTVNYMSPEQAKGEKVDQRTDIFSLGVVLYEMIAGRTPFQGDSISETFANLIKTEPQLLSRYAANVPDELQWIIAKTLGKNKDERYQTAKDLLLDLKILKENSAFESQNGRVVTLPNNNETQILPTSTDQTNKQTDEHQNNFATKIKRYKWAVFTVLAIILVIGSYFAFFAKRSSSFSVREIKSVMVLPLKNIGGDAQDEYLSDGITDELISRLTKLKTVRVVSPSAAMRYKNSPKDAAEIGREMNVEAVIEGTVRKQATKFRVSLHLVNSQDGFELWSDSNFENDLSKLLDSQSQIAEAMANRLKGELTPQEHLLITRENTANADAYEFFLRGKQQHRNREFQLARELFDRAVQLDSNFADAYAWRGRAIYNLFARGSGNRASLDAAISDANRALQINPNIISARRTLIDIYHSTGQYEEGLKQGKFALETNADDPDAILGMAFAYFRVGMLNKAIPLFQRAVDSDPTDVEIRNGFARTYFYQSEYQKGIDVLLPALARGDDVTWVAMLNYQGLRQYDKAIEMGRLEVSRHPNEPLGRLNLALALKLAGKPDEARQVWLEAIRSQEAQVASFENVRTRIWIGFYYAYLGEREKALEQINRAVTLEPNDAWTLYQAGSVHAVLNNRREALDYLKKSIEHGWLGVHYFDWDSDPNGFGSFANLRDDAEFKQIWADLQKKVDELAKEY